MWNWQIFLGAFGGTLIGTSLYDWTKQLIVRNRFYWELFIIELFVFICGIILIVTGIYLGG